jgi:hypothetical protein
MLSRSLDSEGSLGLPCGVTSGEDSHSLDSRLLSRSLDSLDMSLIVCSSPVGRRVTDPSSDVAAMQCSPVAALRNANLALRFLLELSALAAVAYGGWEAGDGATSPIFAVVFVAAFASVWGLFLSPKRRIELGDPARLALELGLWLAAGAALYTTGHAGLAIAFVAVAVVSGAVNYAWQ